MPIFKLEGDKIIELTQTTFSNEKIDEAHDLQKFIINSIETVEKNLFVISSEFGDWEDSRRRVDILCLDKDANLVVVELKRTEDGGHMELQSIRYAAMVASLTFDKAVRAYQQYLKKNGIDNIDAQEEIMSFLEWDEVNEEEFANDVRIILVSADFSKEITTSVLWLIERDIDIKCIRIKPQKDGDNLYFDIQQIIPLPEATDYTVKLREKAAEQRQARRESSRDYTKYNLTIGDINETNLNKRQTMHLAMSQAVRLGISPERLMELTGSKRWIWVDKFCNSKEEFESSEIHNVRSYDSSRWFNADNELIQFEGKTYAFSNQHGKGTYDLVTNTFQKFPELKGEITKNES
ncbi:hypothetical protein JMN32_05140 [Fulvivirga sp. 29W222]|uniref:DUF91 domain-containing protein n=1 Tax=Fulvivirga marina TaxID=2494733 RepID=A0A937KB71_9BACT|nr:hypothetical protein [Fulvivirga marina]MBL6445682.1 hypothetical protein [Fulvivirga marina]